MNSIEELERKLDGLLINPSKPQLYNEIGVLLYQFNDLEKSDIYLKKAFQLCPEDTDILYNYGSLLYFRFKFKQAKSIFETYIHLESDNIDVLEKLAYIYYQLGEYEMASKSVISLNSLNKVG